MKKKKIYLYLMKVPTKMMTYRYIFILQNYVNVCIFIVEAKLILRIFAYLYIINGIYRIKSICDIINNKIVLRRWEGSTKNITACCMKLSYCWAFGNSFLIVFSCDLAVSIIPFPLSISLSNVTTLWDEFPSKCTGGLNDSPSYFFLDVPIYEKPTK